MGGCGGSAADAQAAIDEADRKYGVSDAVADATAKAAASIDAVDQKYAISESMQDASDRAAVRIAEAKGVVVVKDEE